MITSTRQFVRMLAAAAVATTTLALASPAWAAKDVIYPSASTVGSGLPPANTGSHGNLQLGAVAPGSTVTFTVTWSIENNRSNGNDNTSYRRTVRFASVAVTDPNASSQLVSLGSGTDTCNVVNATVTCVTPISFTAPSTTGNYLARVTSADTVSGNGNDREILGKHLNVSFNVLSASTIATQTTLDGPYCAYLNGSKSFAATLATTASPPVGIGGKLLDFSLETTPGGGNFQSIGGAMTATPSGTANLVDVSLAGRGLGDYTLKASFAGDSTYAPSHGTTTLGIQYMSTGFLPPINPDGNTVFGNGRAIPIKLRISDANGNPIPNATLTVTLAKLGEAIPVSSVSAANSGTTMRYSPADDLYIYNWDLGSLSNGTYLVSVNLGSSSCTSVAQATITVNKRNS